VPEVKFDWKPHEKSMIFGYLVGMVATIPTWISMQINQAELHVAPPASNMKRERLETSAELIAALDKSAADRRAAFAHTTDEHLDTDWRLLAGGKVVMEAPRYSMIQDTLNHWVASSRTDDGIPWH
jgi:hypothetical protein